MERPNHKALGNMPVARHSSSEGSANGVTNLYGVLKMLLQVYFKMIKKKLLAYNRFMHAVARLANKISARCF